MTRSRRLVCCAATCTLLLMILHDRAGLGATPSDRGRKGDFRTGTEGEFGHFSTTWRQWPGERRADITFPQSVGAEAIATPFGRELVPVAPMAPMQIPKSEVYGSPPEMPVEPPRLEVPSLPPGSLPPIPLSPTEEPGSSPMLPGLPPKVTPATELPIELPGTRLPGLPIAPDEIKPTPVENPFDSSPAPAAEDNPFRGEPTHNPSEQKPGGDSRLGPSTRGSRPVVLDSASASGEASTPPVERLAALGPRRTPSPASPTPATPASAKRVPAAADAGAPPTRQNSGLLTVYVPYDAKVTINGLRTQSEGSRRRFVSYGLRPGFSYKYVVRVEVVHDNQLIVDTKAIVLTAGDLSALAFGFNALPPRPTPALLAPISE